MNLTQCIRGGSQDKRNGFIIGFHYDQDVVENLKMTIPHTDREYYPASRQWWISIAYEDVLKKLFSNFDALAHKQGKLWTT